MAKVFIGGAILCGLIAIVSFVMIFVRLEQWLEFLCVAGGGCIGVFVFLLMASVKLQQDQKGEG